MDELNGLTPRKRALGVAAQVELQKRRVYTLQGALHPEREGKLFEHFVVTGLPSSIEIQPPPAALMPFYTQSNQASSSFTHHKIQKSAIQETFDNLSPQILYSYPHSDTIHKLLVTQFSFPEGLASDKIRRLPSELEMNELVFAPLSKLEESSSSFVFLLTTDNALLYGICVVHDELVRDELSFIPKPGKMEKGETRQPEIPQDVGWIVAPRCYILLTRFPFFSTHFQVLYSLLALERTTRMYKTMVPDHTPQGEVQQLLQHYYSLEVPKSDNTSLEIDLGSETLTFHCPPGDEDAQLADSCLGAILKLIPLDLILLLLSAVLQEHQVLIVSSQVSIISSIVMGIIPLMRPFVWQGTFIPVLPSTLEECVHSPMPYILGLQKVSQDSKDILENIFWLNIDQTNIVRRPQNLAPLPYESDLKQQLIPIHSKIYCDTPSKRKATYLQPYSNSPEEIEIGRSFLNILRNYHRELHVIIDKGIGTIRNFDITNPRHLYKLVCAVSDDNYQGFLKPFLSSQHWHFFYEKVKPDEDIYYNYQPIINHNASNLSSSLWEANDEETHVNQIENPETPLHKSTEFINSNNISYGAKIDSSSSSSSLSSSLRKSKDENPLNTNSSASISNPSTPSNISGLQQISLITDGAFSGDDDDDDDDGESF